MAKRVGAPGVKITIRIGNKSKTFESLQEAAKAFKISYNVFYARMFTMGWSPTKAATTPVQKRKRKTKAKKRK